MNCVLSFLSREKLFEVRPNTAQINWSPLQGLKEATVISKENTKKKRCPTCRGQPERPKIVNYCLVFIKLYNFNI